MTREDMYLDENLLKLLYRLKTEEPETYNHSLEVSRYATLLGRYLNLERDDIDTLEVAGMLHDIGKLKVDKNILHKPSGLTYKEFQEIKKHPIYGIELLEEINFKDDNVLNIIKFHHEKVDGSGYPDKLKGDKIPFLTKIVSIADSYSAMTQDRVYRKHQNSHFVFSELIRNSGTQFDEYLIYKFVELLDRERTCNKDYTKEEDIEME